MNMMRKFLFIGSTGVGKSTLLNSLYNDSSSIENMRSPAGATDTAQGVTAEIKTYYNFLGRVGFVDSIGFGDNRFEPEEIITVLKTLLKRSRMGFNLIFFVVRHGRLSKTERDNLTHLDTLFGKSCKNRCVIVFTSSPANMTLEKYKENNKTDKEILHFLEGAHDVVFGNNQIEEEDEDMEALFLKKRNVFRATIQEKIKNSPKEMFKVEPEGLAERLMELLQTLLGIHTQNTKSAFKNSYNLMKEAFSLTNYFSSHYGECVICTEDMEGDPSQIQVCACAHVFHSHCLNQWMLQQKTCPLCRASLNK